MLEMCLWKWQLVRSRNFDRFFRFVFLDEQSYFAIFKVFSNLKNVRCGSVVSSSVRELDSYRCEIVCGNSVAVREIDVRLQIVAILLLLSLVCQCIGRNNTVMDCAQAHAQVEISGEERLQVEHFREKSSHVEIFRKGDSK